jgi:hypothetical protein
MAYLISEKTKAWTFGSFSLQARLDVGHDENNPPIFNVVPDLNQGKHCSTYLCYSLFCILYFGFTKRHCSFFFQLDNKHIVYFCISFLLQL